MRAAGALLLGLIKTLISMWELLTNWAYTILTQPASKLDDYRRTLAAPKEQIKEKDTEVGAFICAQIFYNLVISDQFDLAWWFGDTYTRIIMSL